MASQFLLLEMYLKKCLVHLVHLMVVTLRVLAHSLLSMWCSYLSE